jgi:hypothetical protein
MVAIYLTERCFKLHRIIYFVVKECYIYSFVVFVDHFPCSNESQFEKWWQDRKQNPVRVIYSIHHSIISFENKVCQAVFIFCKIWHTKSPPDCVLAVKASCVLKQIFTFYYYHWLDTSVGGLLFTEDTISHYFGTDMVYEIYLLLKFAVP